MTSVTEFDTRLLAPPLFQFAIVADSHDKLPAAAVDPEFPSRSLQHDRVATLLQLMRHVPADFVVHMGDLVQEYPGTSGFSPAFAAAVEAFHRLPMPVFHVAGNHDVGDKPDRTMPTHPPTPESLAEYHRLCGPSWQRIDRADCRLLLINSQLLDTGMPEETAQRAWLESELAAAADRRVLLFLHLPLFLGREDEPALGNYDVLGNASRRWLLDLIRKHRVEFVAGAHVHFAFFDLIDRTEYHQLASPCFTRPGFAHLFSSPPPEERGRNDRPKLGFYLARVLANDIRLHFIRTAGATTPRDLVPEGARIVVFPAAAGGRGSSLGVTLREPILREGEVPIAFPSVVRQRVRNDYPLYHLQELGAAHLRVPRHDWDDPAQRRRLAWLAAKGVSLTLFALDETGVELPVPETPEKLPLGIEWQLPGCVTPPEESYTSWVRSCRERGYGVALAPVVAGKAQAGKQHPRTRVGYSPATVAEINAWLRDQEQTVDRVVIDLGPEASSWETWMQAAAQCQPQDPAWDLKLELASVDDDRNCAQLAEAIVLCLAIPRSRLFLDPLTDHDRTMDAVHGLCDTMHNPRPPFAVYRAMNGILFPEALASRAGRKFDVRRLAVDCFSISVDGVKYALIISDRAAGALPAAWSAEILWDLRRGQSRDWTPDHPVKPPFLITYRET